MTGLTSAFPGNTNYVELGVTSRADVKVLVTVRATYGSGNVNAWSAYENGSWRIYVSDPSFTGQVSYLII